MNKIVKKVLGIFALTSAITLMTSCSNANDAKKETAIDEVYIKKGSSIAEKTSEYEKIQYNELEKYDKLSDGIFVIFKLKANVYIDTVTFSQKGATNTTIAYKAGVSSTFTYNDYEDDDTRDTYGSINVSSNNEIIIDDNYLMNEYFYFSLNSYCQYSDIKINYSSEKPKTDDVFSKYAKVGDTNFKLSDLKSSNGIAFERRNSDIIIPINRNIKIKNISLSLKLYVIYHPFGGSDYTHYTSLTEDNFKNWSNYNNTSSAYDFTYTVDYNLSLNTFISNVKSTKKADVESLDYLNTYKEKVFNDNTFDYTNSKNYETESLDYNAKDGDYLIINFNEVLVATASYKYIYQVPFMTEEIKTSNYTFYEGEWMFYITNISDFEIEYEAN